MNNNNKEKEPWTGSSTNPFKKEGLNSYNSVDQQDPAVNTDVTGNASDNITDNNDGNEATTKAGKPYRGRKAPVLIDDVERQLAAWDISVRRNVISGQVDISGMPCEYSYEDAANVLPAILTDHFRAQGRSISRASIKDALEVISDKNRYNPVIQMIDDTVYDGNDRIALLYRILGIQDEPWHCLLLRKWLHQAIAIAFNNEKHPYGSEGTLVLQGAQGIGKTQFFSIISSDPDLFEEGMALDLRNKDNVIQSISAWTVELGELDGTLRKEQAQIKAHISRKRDTVRFPYAYAQTHKTRCTIYCATVNPEQFLRDETGSRRFWVIHVDQIDLDTLLSLDHSWIRQMWRQVYETLYLPNPQGFRLTPDEQKELEQRNRRYYLYLPGEEVIRSSFDFTLSKDRWQWYQIRQLVDRLDMHGISDVAMGKVLSKLAKEYPEIQVKNPHNVREYYLPIN